MSAFQPVVETEMSSLCIPRHLKVATNDPFSKDMNYYKQSISILLAVSVFIVAGNRAKADLSVPLEGTWKVNASTDSGQKHYTMTISKKDEVLGGSISEDGKDESRDFDRVSVDGKVVNLGIDIESDGQSGVLKVKAEEKETGTLFGRWSIEDSAGTEFMAGEWEATKEVADSLVGEWDTVAELPDGGNLKSLLTVEGSPGDYSGSFKSEAGKSAVKKIAEEGAKVTIDVVMEREGVTMDVQLRTEKEDDELEGTWHLSDGNGGESASGKWMATRRKAFTIVGNWNVVAILPEGDELQAVFEISESDEGELVGIAKIDDGQSELKTIAVGEKGEVTMTLGYEMDGTAGLVTIEATTEGDHTLKGNWKFSSVSGSENYEGAWSASRASEKRGVLRGR